MFKCCWLVGWLRGHCSTFLISRTLHEEGFVGLEEVIAGYLQSNPGLVIKLLLWLLIRLNCAKAGGDDDSGADAYDDVVPRPDARCWTLLKLMAKRH